MIAPPRGYRWPPGTGWAWRADLAAEPTPLWPARRVAAGARLTSAVKVFHDAGAAYLAPGPGGLSVWSEKTAAGYLSLVVDLPSRGLAGMTPRHLVTLSGRARLWPDRRLLARINLRHGPNTTRQERPARIVAGLLLAEFDLAYAALDHAPISAAWIDLIVERPLGAALAVTDLTIDHRLRAEP